MHVRLNKNYVLSLALSLALGQGCKPVAIDSENQSIIGLSTEVELGRDFKTFVALQHWFDCFQKNPNFQGVNSKEDLEACAAPQSSPQIKSTKQMALTVNPKSLPPDLQRYLQKETETLNAFERVLESGEVNLMIKLLEQEAEEMHDIILVMLTGQHKITSGSLLATFIQNTSGYGLEGGSTKAFFQAVTDDRHYELPDIINSLNVQKSRFIDHLKAKYIANGKINDEALKSAIARSRSILAGISGGNAETQGRGGLALYSDKQMQDTVERAIADMLKSLLSDFLSSEGSSRSSPATSSLTQNDSPDRCDYKRGTEQGCSEFRKGSRVPCQDKSLDIESCNRYQGVPFSKLKENKIEVPSLSKDLPKLDRLRPTMDFNSLLNIKAPKHKQPGSGPCTAWAGTAAMQYAVAFQEGLLATPKFDPAKLWKTYGNSTLRYNWDVAIQAASSFVFREDSGSAYKMVFAETVMNSRLKNPKLVEDALRKGYVVWASLPLTSAWHKTNIGKTCIVDFTKDAAFRGKDNYSHSIAIVGFEQNQSAPGGGYFHFKNSWGEGWGCNGIAKLPYGYCLLEKHTCYGEAIRAKKI